MGIPFPLVPTKQHNFMYMHLTRAIMNRRSAFLCTLCSSCLLTLGCSKEPHRILVTGLVKYQDQPLEHGAISFLPTADTVGASVSIVTITNGKYMVDKQGGLSVGNYKVAIVEVDMATTERTATGEKPPPSKKKQRIPAKYNDQTQLKAKIDGSQNPLTLDFSLAP